MIQKAIPSAPAYEASEDGRIWRHGRALKARSNGHGYMRVTVSIGNRARTIYVHRLICEVFHGPCPPGHQVRHLNGCRDNNVPGNLQWATKAVNELDKRRHGTLRWGETGGQARLTRALVLEARSRVAAGERASAIAVESEVSAHALTAAVTGRRWANEPGATGQLRRMLSAAEVEQIRTAVAGGIRKAEVARQHGVRWGTVQRIVTGARHAKLSKAEADSAVHEPCSCAARPQKT